jgi:putative hydrolase of the HAD superfamily
MSMPTAKEAWLGPRPLAILVDLDDTIVSDSDRAGINWAAAVDAAVAVVPFPAEAVLAAIEIELDWFWSDPERHRVGRSDLIGARRSIVTAALRRAAIPEADLPTAIAAIMAAYGARTEADRGPFPGALDALHTFRDLGIKLALVTNGAAAVQRAKIERFELAPLFDAIVVEGEFGLGKPEPAVYAHALASLGVSAADAWMVGDNLEWDVATPRRLGMKGIWITKATTVLDAAGVGADAILPDLPALARLVSAIAPPLTSRLESWS